MAHNEEFVLKLFFVLELHGTSYHSAMAGADARGTQDQFDPNRINTTLAR
jgi:hypothetical protein